MYKYNVLIISNIDTVIQINFAISFQFLIFANDLANNQADKFDY